MAALIWTIAITVLVYIIVLIVMAKKSKLDFKENWFTIQAIPFVVLVVLFCVLKS
jgi:hypothetical protein